MYTIDTLRIALSNFGIRLCSRIGTPSAYFKKIALIVKFLVSYCAFLIIALSFSGCSFVAVHKNQSVCSSIIGQIKIQDVGKIGEFATYQELESILDKPREGDAKWLLEYHVTYSYGPQIIKRDSDPLREAVRANVTYIVKDIKNDRTVYHGSFAKISSYNMNMSPYSTTIQKEATINDLAHSIAQEMLYRLNYHFCSH
jgi:hypothetical protein